MIELKVIYELARLNSGMSDIERLTNIYAFLSSQVDLNVEGDVVEVGCNAGYTSAFMSLVLKHHDTSGTKTLHVYDSFQGLPVAGKLDSYLQDTDLAVNPQSVIDICDSFKAPLPTIHEGWFEDTLPCELPETISFAYLDGDYESSIYTSLKYVYPRLAHGGIIIVDDYCDLEKAPRSWDGLPGVKAACDRFAKENNIKINSLIGSNDLSFGMIRKLYSHGK